MLERRFHARMYVPRCPPFGCTRSRFWRWRRSLIHESIGFTASTALAPILRSAPSRRATVRHRWAQRQRKTEGARRRRRMRSCRARSSCSSKCGHAIAAAPAAPSASAHTCSHACTPTRGRQQTNGRTHARCASCKCGCADRSCTYEVAVAHRTAFVQNAAGKSRRGAGCDARVPAGKPPPSPARPHPDVFPLLRRSASPPPLQTTAVPARPSWPASVRHGIVPVK